MGEKLEELAETFGGQFNVEPLEVYDALQQLWKVAKNQGQFATPVSPPHGGKLLGGTGWNISEGARDG